MERKDYLKYEKECLRPIVATAGSAGIDICCAEGVTLKPGEQKLVSTGITLDLNHLGMPSFFLLIRSSLSLKGWALTNGVGLIDSDYNKVIKVSLYNRGKDTLSLEVGERVAQLVPIGKPVDSVVLPEPYERKGGFGSTN